MKTVRMRGLGGLIGCLLIMTIIVAKLMFIALVIYCLAAGNFWCTDAGALREVRVVSPDMNRIVDIDRGILKKTRVIVQDKDGKRETFLLDCNILWSCKIINKEGRSDDE